MPELKLGLNDKLMFEATGRTQGKGKAVAKKRDQLKDVDSDNDDDDDDKDDAGSKDGEVTPRGGKAKKKP